MTDGREMDKYEELGRIEMAQDAIDSFHDHYAGCLLEEWIENSLEQALMIVEALLPLSKEK